VPHKKESVLALRLAALTVWLLVQGATRVDKHAVTLCSGLILDIVGSGELDALPKSFDAMCDTLRMGGWVDLEMIIRASPSPESGPSAFQRALDLKDRLAPAGLESLIEDPGSYTELAVLAVPAVADPVELRRAEAGLYQAEMCEGWRPIVRALRDLRSGRVTIAKLVGLDQREERIVRAIWGGIARDGQDNS
jgi:hypothetical protein